MLQWTGMRRAVRFVVALGIVLVVSGARQALIAHWHKEQRLAGAR